MSQVKETIDQVAELTSGDLIGAFLWLVFIVGPLVAIRSLWKKSKIVKGWRKWGTNILIAALVLFYISVPIPFILYALSRKVTVVGNLFSWLYDKVPELGSVTLGYLNAEILPTPRLWHLLVAMIFGLTFFLLRRLRIPSRALVVNPPTQPENIDNSRPIVPQESPHDPPMPPKQLPPVMPEVFHFGMNWKKIEDFWQAICPSCHSQVAIKDEQRKGMVIRTGNPRTTMAVGYCPNHQCSRQYPLTMRDAALQSRIQREYDDQHR